MNQASMPLQEWVSNNECYAPGKIPETPVILESGCDTPEEAAEPPVLHLPSPGPSIMPVGQVRQFSCVILINMAYLI